MQHFQVFNLLAISFSFFLKKLLKNYIKEKTLSIITADIF